MEIFISYAWGGESEQIVNEIDKKLQNKGIKIIRDKRDLGFKGLITDFMKKIGSGNAVILVIGEKYLKSPYCMFELIEVYRNQNFVDRVFPIVLDDANIYSPIPRLQYLKHWQEKKKELDDAIMQFGTDAITVIGDDYKTYKKIFDNFGEIVNVLMDINSLTPQMHKSSEFSELIKAIEKQMGQAKSTAINQAVDRVASSGYNNDIVFHSMGPPNYSISVNSDIHIGCHNAGSVAIETHNNDLNNYQYGKLLYSLPNKMIINEHYKCVIRIAKILELLDKNYQKTAYDKITDIKISDIMKVELVDLMSGQNFIINAVSSLEQYLDDLDPTEWIFMVTPIKAGTHNLLIRISVIKTIQGKERYQDNVKEIVTEVVSSGNNEEIEFYEREMDLSFVPTPSPHSAISEIKTERNKAILKRLEMLNKLLSDYEDKLLLEDDPKKTMLYEKEVDKLKKQIETTEKELLKP